MWYTRSVSDSKSESKSQGHWHMSLVSYSDVPLAFRTSISICCIEERSYGWVEVLFVITSVAEPMLEL